MLNELRKIRYARFRLEVTAASQLRLPPYKLDIYKSNRSQVRFIRGWPLNRAS